MARPYGSKGTRVTRRTFIMVLLLWVSSVAAADIIYVDYNSPNEPGSGTFEDPFRQIQPAIDAASTGDILQLSQGIYTGFNNYNLSPSGKN